MKATAFGILFCLVSLFLMLMKQEVGVFLFPVSAIIGFVGLCTQWDKTDEEDAQTTSSKKPESAEKAESDK